MLLIERKVAEIPRPEQHEEDSIAIISRDRFSSVF